MKFWIDFFPNPFYNDIRKEKMDNARASTGSFKQITPIFTT